jgi:Sec-independent protein secretion pathway component TatC
MLAIPIVVLYEISIYMAKLVEKKRPKDEYDDDDDLDEDDDEDTGADRE